MDFGRRLADPIMEDTVVNSLFFSSQRYGRFFFLPSATDVFASFLGKHVFSEICEEV